MNKILLVFTFIVIYLAPSSIYAINDDVNLDFYEATPYNEALTLKERNKQLGIVTTHDILDDKIVWGVSGNINSDVSKMTELINLQVNMLKNIDYFWLGGFVSQTSATFEAISHQNDNLDPSDPIDLSSSEKILSFGLSIGHRFFWIQNLLSSIINTQDIYEFTTASLTYQSMSEAHHGASFKGYGVQTEFNIIKRFSPSYHLGFKTTYSLSSLKRGEEEGGSSANSLVVSWLSFGLELGLYF